MTESAARKKKQDVENSVELRVVSFILTGICLAAFCFYADAPVVITTAYVTAAALGSYLSHIFRKRKSLAVTWLTILGTCAILGSFIGEAIGQFYGAGQFMIPFMRVLCGLLVLHTFDLRTRADLYIGALIGLGLLGCVASQAEKMMTFAAFPIAFIIFGSFFLYLLSVSHSQEGEPAVVTESHRPPSGSMFGIPQPIKRKRTTTGSTLLLLASLPFIAFLLFLMIPRTGASLVDLIAEQARDLIIKIQARLDPPKAPPSTAYVPPKKVSLPPFQRPSDKGAKLKNEPPPKKPPLSPGKGTGSDKNPDQEKDVTKSEPLSGYKPQPGEKGKDGKGSGKGSGKGDGKGDSRTPGKKGKNGKSNGQSEPAKPSRTINQMLLGKGKGTADSPDTVLFTVRANRPAYLRCVAFDSYKGDRWVHSSAQRFLPWKEVSKDAYNLADFASFRLPVNFRGSELEAHIDIKSEMPQYIPAGWIPQSLHFPEKIRVGNDGSLVIDKGADKGLDPGLFYTAVSLVPAGDLKDMRSAEEPDNNELRHILTIGKRYLAVPQTLPERVRALARKEGGAGGNWFAKAERIAEYLRKNYKHSLDKPELNPEFDSTDQFLFETRSGACGQFASAEVLMARCLGIPARVVVGYAPGEKDPKAEQYTIRQKHEHAWAEVFSPSHGWVPIDATPQGSLPLQPQQDSLGARTVIRSTRKVDPQGESEKVETPGNRMNWDFTRQFQNPYTVAVLWAILVFVVIDSLRRYYLWWSEKRRREAEEAGKSASTILFMKLVRDLERLRITRARSDTPEDLLVRVHNFVETDPSVPYALKAELPLLVDNFIELYHLERFAKEEENLAEYNKLGEIGDKIHELVLQSTLTSSPRK